jgi:tetrahydromethanopterin S-methyltransferase subunit F
MNFKDFKSLIIGMLFALVLIVGFAIAFVFETIVFDIAHILVKRIDLFFNV